MLDAGQLVQLALIGCEHVNQGPQRVGQRHGRGGIEQGDHTLGTGPAEGSLRGRKRHLARGHDQTGPSDHVAGLLDLLGVKPTARARVDRNRVVAVGVDQNQRRAVGLAWGALHMTAVNAFTLPQIEPHLTKVITADAGHQAHASALPSRCNGRIASLAPGQTLKVAGQQGLPTRQRCGHAGHQIHVPTGDANHLGH